MQNHPWDADDPTQPYRDDANDDANRTPPDDELDAIPAPLRNWQVMAARPPAVIEIDGEATVIDGPADDAATPAPIMPPSRHDAVDSTVVAGLAAARVTVVPGETATLTVNLLNNGHWPSLFEIALEGWIDERWCPDLPTRVHLQPGERQTVALTLTPPLSPTVTAGEHEAVVTVRAPRYPGHVTRLGVTLAITPHVDVQLGALTPRRVRTTWFRRSARVHLPLINRGNTAATVQLSARDRDHECDFFFLTADLNDFAVDDDAVPVGRTQVTLAPGTTTAVAVEIRPHTRPLFGLASTSLPFRVTAQPLAPVAAPVSARVAAGRLSVAPLIGLWHLVVVAVFGVVALFGTGLAGLALLMALRSTPVTVAPTPAAVAAPAAPVVAFVIQLGEPAPTRVPPAMTTPAPSAPSAGAAAAPPESVGVPVISADQVSAPGEPRLQPIAPTAAVPTVASAAVATSARPLTYAEMFREVALRFDLNWRMLAAQAYVESGFDAVALGSRGDMGLMQILPDTWREWSPTVAAADPFDSYSNVLVAAAYLDHIRTLLSSRGYPQPGWMLVAYNWGPDQVLNFLADGGTWETLPADRRDYAEEITRIAESIPAN